MGSSVDLISSTEFMAKTVKNNQGYSEDEPKVTTMLMDDLCQEAAPGATQANDEITEEVGGAENPPSSAPQEETNDPQPIAAPTSADPEDAVIVE